MKKCLFIILVLCVASYVHAGWWYWNGSVDTDPLKQANWTDGGGNDPWTADGPGWQDGLIINVDYGATIWPVLTNDLLWMTYPIQVGMNAEFTVTTGGAVDHWQSVWYMDVLSNAKLRIEDDGFYRTGKPFTWPGSEVIVTDNATVYFGTFGDADTKIDGTFDLSGNAEIVITGGDFTADPLLDNITYSITELDGLGAKDAFYDSENNWTLVHSVPEPATLILLGIGSSMLLRRKK
jgi:hypothetical protein